MNDESKLKLIAHYFKINLGLHIVKLVKTYSHGIDNFQLK